MLLLAENIISISRQFLLALPTPSQTWALPPSLLFGHCTSSCRKWQSNQCVPESSCLLVILVLSSSVLNFHPQINHSHSSLLQGSRGFPIQCQPQWHLEMVNEIVTVSPQSKASLFCPFIPNPEVPATGKLLTVSCISASHSKPKNRRESRAEAGIDIFNHSVSPLTLFDGSTRPAVGKSAADSGTSTSRQVLYL